MEKKEILLNKGVSQQVIDFIEAKNDRVLNGEGREIGEKFTILGIADNLNESVINGEKREWVEAVTDSGNISISTLCGTKKTAKYFNLSEFNMSEDTDTNRMVSEEVDNDGNPQLEVISGFDLKDVISFKSNRISDVVLECVEGGVLHGKTLQLVAVRRVYNTRFESWQKYNLFKIVG